jgi:hypothetical protein
MAREQLNMLSYSELAALAARLTETADTVGAPSDDTVRNPSLVRDLHHAAGAVSDLASIKFGIEEIAASTHDSSVAAELLGLIGRES